MPYIVVHYRSDSMRTRSFTVDVRWSHIIILAFTAVAFAAVAVGLSQ